ncbi:MAG TPA: sugar phosphate isomerase/epimerase family protein [Streptosporangiaceae bacterium]|nr:sugar phosphate isomerase/epimerase family protein [Streptosporangiaceae bacterium]
MPPEPTYAGVADEAAPGLAGQVAAIRELGWRRIELRNVDGHAIADLDERAFDRLTGTLADAGLSVVCVDSRIANWARPVTAPFGDDLHELEVLARRCTALGTPYVRIMSYPNDGLDEVEWGRRVLDRMRTLAARAEAAGLVLLHENCSGWAGTRPDRMRRLVEATGGTALRLLFDTGNGIAYGYEAYDVLAEIVDLVEHVQVKDAAGTSADPVYTMPGDGSSRVADCLRLLFSRGYAGTISIEPHLHVRPHEGRTGGRADADKDAEKPTALAESFVTYGRRLERLVAGLRAEAGADTAIPEGVTR